MAVKNTPKENTKKAHPLALQISEQEASDRYGMSVAWFRRMRCVGGGPVYRKIGNRCFYPVADLEKYFEDRTVKHTAEYQTRRPVEAIAKKRGGVAA